MTYGTLLPRRHVRKTVAKERPRIEQPLPEERRWRHMLDMPDYVYERKFREGNKHRVHILIKTGAIHKRLTSTPMVYEYLEEIGKANDFKDGIKFCSRPRYDHYTQKLAEREAPSKKKTREDRNVPSASGVPTAGTCQAMPTRPVQDHERRKRTTTGTADRVVTLSDSYSGSRVTSHPVGESTDDDDFTSAPVSVPMAHVSRSIASRPTRPGAHHAAPISDSQTKMRKDRNVRPASGVPTAGTCQAMPTRPVQDHERRKRTTTSTADRVVTLSDSYSGSHVTSHPVGESTDDDDFTAAPVSVPMAHVSRSIASRPTRPGAHHAAPISDSQATVVLATSPSATPLSSPRFRHPTPLRVDSISRQGGLVLPRGDAYADRVNETLSGNVPQDESLSEEENYVPPVLTGRGNYRVVSAVNADFLRWCSGRGSRSSAAAKLASVTAELSLYVRRNGDLPSVPTAPGTFPCKGCFAFRCPCAGAAHHDTRRCRQSSKNWSDIRFSLGAKSWHLHSRMKSLQRFVETLPWTINALFGLLAIKLSKDVIWEEDYVPNRGPFCAICERRVPFLSYASRQACRTCSSRITRDYYAPVTGYPIRTDVRRGVNPETLYYLCIRKSGTPGELQETSFTDMIESITQSQFNPGSFGGTNRPGHPSPWRVAGKFACGASAMAPLWAMTYPVNRQPEDVYPLCRLVDCITADYYPGDTIVIAMSHPGNFCAGFQDIDDFIRDLVLSGIPHECIFFYYHGLDAETSGIEKYETVVSGLELRMGIAQRVPLCAMRPAVSGVLYEAAKVVLQRTEGPHIGRNTIITQNRLTESQLELTDVNLVRRQQLRCAEPSCRQHLVQSPFALDCVGCGDWFHGNCVHISPSTLASIQAHNSVWICRSCHMFMLLEKGDIARALQLSYESSDNSVFKAMCLKVDAAFDWEQVFDHFRNSVGCTYKMDFDCLALCASKATVSVLSRHPALGRLFANPYKRQLLNILECCPHLDTGVLEVLQSAAYTDSDASRTVTDRVPCPAAADVVTSKVTRGKAVSSPCVPQTVLTLAKTPPRQSTTPVALSGSQRSDTLPVARKKTKSNLPRANAVQYGQIPASPIPRRKGVRMMSTVQVAQYQRRALASQTS